MLFRDFQKRDKVSTLILKLYVAGMHPGQIVAILRENAISMTYNQVCRVLNRRK